MRIKLYIIGLIYLFIFCINCDYKRGIEKVLINNCYWDICDKENNYNGNYSWKFSSQGKCQYFSYNYSNGEKRSVSIYKGGRPDIWSIKEDTLNARFTKLIIKRYNSDTIFLIGYNSNDKIMLIKNCRNYVVE